MFEDIINNADWMSVIRISKGWSSDEKFMITMKSGEKQLLRLASIDRYDDKKKEFEIISKYSKTGIVMSMPIAFGVCNQQQNVYMICSWLEGCDLEDILAELSEQEQYSLGRMAGEILRKIHAIALDDADIPVKTKKDKKLLQLARYEKSSLRIADDEVAVKYIYEHIDRIWSVPPVYQHGDFHPGNLIYMEDGSIGVIDFNRWEVGDPYEEFYKLESFGREISIPYCIGQIESYFQDRIPQSFWETLAVYVAHASLYSIKWAEPFGLTEIEEMKQHCLQAFEDYDNFRLTIPKWYKS